MTNKPRSALRTGQLAAEIAYLIENRVILATSAKPALDFDTFAAGRTEQWKFLGFETRGDTLIGVLHVLFLKERGIE